MFRHRHLPHRSLHQNRLYVQDRHGQRENATWTANSHIYRPRRLPKFLQDVYSDANGFKQPSTSRY
uniref:Uncharacterized protein n=1 Tax=Human betaherpesvirus 6 TaxID=10368 RepID=A0A5P9U7U0_9BETA|nr:hypothetical protein [Human betaherpesvirus 6]